MVCLFVCLYLSVLAIEGQVSKIWSVITAKIKLTLRVLLLEPAVLLSRSDILLLEPALLLLRSGILLLELACEQALGLGVWVFVVGRGWGEEKERELLVPFPPSTPCPQQKPKSRARELARRLYWNLFFCYCLMAFCYWILLFCYCAMLVFVFCHFVLAF